MKERFSRNLDSKTIEQHITERKKEVLDIVKDIKSCIDNPIYKTMKPEMFRKKNIDNGLKKSKIDLKNVFEPVKVHSRMSSLMILDEIMKKRKNSNKKQNQKEIERNSVNLKRGFSQSDFFITSSSKNNFEQEEKNYRKEKEKYHYQEYLEQHQSKNNEILPKRSILNEKLKKVEEKVNNNELIQIPNKNDLFKEKEDKEEIKLSVFIPNAEKRVSQKFKKSLHFHNSVHFFKRQEQNFELKSEIPKLGKEKKFEFYVKLQKNSKNIKKISKKIVQGMNHLSARTYRNQKVLEEIKNHEEIKMKEDRETKEFVQQYFYSNKDKQELSDKITKLNKISDLITYKNRNIIVPFYGYVYGKHEAELFDYEIKDVKKKSISHKADKNYTTLKKLLYNSCVGESKVKDMLNKFQKNFV